MKKPTFLNHYTNLILACGSLIMFQCTKQHYATKSRDQSITVRLWISSGQIK